MTKYFTKEGDDFKEVDGELLTQDAVDKVVKDRAERLARQQFGDYDDLKKKAGEVDSIKSDYQKQLDEAKTKATELEKQLSGAKLETDKVKIVSEFKLPDDLAEFVTGDSADEMRTRAEKLAKGIKPSQVNIDKDGKPKDATPSGSKKIAGQLFGKSDD